MTDLHFNQPERLAPVGCYLLIQMPDGSVLMVRRTSHIQKRGRAMDYELSDGTIITGKYPWTYP